MKIFGQVKRVSKMRGEGFVFKRGFERRSPELNTPKRKKERKN